MNIIERLSTDFERFYMANSILGIIVSSCLGSIAAMMILADGNSVYHVIHLSWIVIAAMIYNASVLVGLKSKMVFFLQVFSVLSSVLSIAYYIFFT
ncbi:hypothetical protein [Psychroflexus sediminis]|uniref:Uncharacterized protein n=1 Tax=Psychroflexus sediminis TaxID=470826 RepID=A0A1G7W628_9FLAO|nr:hypothetical protein [Psychroflexus sediminis]SDG67321.1 hypothetical protein SAMN04488027_10514 [Psychroflexus sediminis]